MSRRPAKEAAKQLKSKPIPKRKISESEEHSEEDNDEDEHSNDDSPVIELPQAIPKKDNKKPVQNLSKPTLPTIILPTKHAIKSIPPSEVPMLEKRVNANPNLNAIPRHAALMAHAPNPFLVEGEEEPLDSEAPRFKLSSKSLPFFANPQPQSLTASSTVGDKGLFKPTRNEFSASQSIDDRSSLSQTVKRTSDTQVVHNSQTQPYSQASSQTDPINTQVSSTYSVSYAFREIPTVFPETSNSVNRSHSQTPSGSQPSAITSAFAKKPLLEINRPIPNLATSNSKESASRSKSALMGKKELESDQQVPRPDFKLPEIQADPGKELDIEKVIERNFKGNGNFFVVKFNPFAEKAFGKSFGIMPLKPFKELNELNGNTLNKEYQEIQKTYDHRCAYLQRQEKVLKAFNLIS